MSILHSTAVTVVLLTFTQSMAKTDLKSSSNDENDHGFKLGESAT